MNYRIIKVLVPSILFVFFASQIALGQAREFKVHSDTLRIDENSGEIHFVGQVLVEMENGKLMCDSLVIHTDSRDPGKVSTGLAKGNVKLIRDEDSLESTEARLDANEGIVEFTGSPQLKRKDSRVSAESIIYQIDDGMVTFHGPIEAVFSAAGEGTP